MINDQDYSERADSARSKPGVWTTLREGQASANLVTRIRSGSVASISPTDFEVRSVKIEGRYDVEIRTRTSDQVDVQRIADLATDRVMEVLYSTLASSGFREVVRRAVVEVVIEETK